VLLVLIPFWQEPQFVAAIVEPLGGGGRQILSPELRIDEQIVVTGKGDLHEAAAVLGDDDEADPLVGELLSRPAEVVNGFDAAGGLCLRVVLRGGCAGRNWASEAAKKGESG